LVFKTTLKQNFQLNKWIFTKKKKNEKYLKIKKNKKKIKMKKTVLSRLRPVS